MSVQNDLIARAVTAEVLAVLGKGGDNLALYQAIKAKLSPLIAAVEEVYYSAHWHPDRPCDADAIWRALRDAAGLPSGQTAARLGPPRADPVRAAAQALIDDVRHRHPGEELYCPVMIALDKALQDTA